MLCIDEFTAFKNANSARTKALLKVTRPNIKRREPKQNATTSWESIIAMSGTPNSNTICDIWAPALIVDGAPDLVNDSIVFKRKYVQVIGMALAMNGKIKKVQSLW